MAVSEETLYEWVRHRNLPALRLGGQYRFNRAELLEWATTQGIHVPAGLFDGSGKGRMPIDLARALRAGGIHYGVGGRDRDTVLQATIERMPLPDDVDKSYLLSVIVAREDLGSTGIGDGIAIPHVRNPIVLHIPQPIVTLCFLEQAIEFEALDGKPVHTLFAMVSPTIAAHLSLLSRLAFALRQPEFSAIIARRGTPSEIEDAAARVDTAVPAPRPEGGGAA